LLGLAGPKKSLYLTSQPVMIEGSVIDNLTLGDMSMEEEKIEEE